MNTPYCKRHTPDGVKSKPRPIYTVQEEVQSDGRNLYKKSKVVEVNERKNMSQYRASDFDLNNIVLSGSAQLLKDAPLMSRSALQNVDSMENGLAQVAFANSIYNQSSDEVLTEPAKNDSNESTPVNDSIKTDLPNSNV